MIFRNGWFVTYKYRQSFLREEAVAIIYHLIALIHFGYKNHFIVLVHAEVSDVIGNHVDLKKDV